MKKIALLGDPSDHGGTLITTNQENDKFKVNGIPVCVEGCLHSCPIQGHGVTAVSARTIKSYCNGKLIITYEAVAGCGAVITPPDRKVYVE